MARKPRIYFPGAIYHVMLRGNTGNAIFFDDKDREYFCSLISEGIQRFAYKIHAFCFMTNHVHLAIQVGEVKLSKIIQNLSFRYARWINRKLKIIGHLFQGRYKAILVDADAYLLQLVRYIHLNPVRAKIVKLPKDYLWSSYCSYLNYVTSNNFKWVTTNSVLGYFSLNHSVALKQFLNFHLESDNDFQEIPFQMGNHKGHAILGDDLFLEKLAGKLKAKDKIIMHLDQLVHLICQFYQIESIHLCSSSRNHIHTKIRSIIALLSDEYCRCSVSTVAKYLHRDIATMSRARNNVLLNLSMRQELADLHNWIKSNMQA